MQIRLYQDILKKHMPKKIPVLDTNVIIRFLTSDSPLQAEKVEDLLKKSEVGSLVIPDLIVAEIVYVLLSFYDLPKEEVVVKLGALLDYAKFKTNKKLLKKTIEVFSENNISFSDAYLCALNLIGKHPYIYTFDKKLEKIEKVIVRTP